MLTNQLKVAYRLLQRQKGYAFINIFGLAVGLTCFILIALFIRFELSYDRFHEHADRIYRVAKVNPGVTFLGTDQWTVTPAPLVDALVNEVPEVESAAQFTRATSLLERGDTRFYEEGLFASERFFEVFSFELLQGDPQTALTEPNTIVLTTALAHKYFGESDPMGQTLTVGHTGEHSDGATEMQVVGIVEEVPANSHFTFDYLVPIASSPELVAYLDDWNSNSYLTYALLRPGHSPETFENRLSALAATYLRPRSAQEIDPSRIDSYFPQALTDIHLHSRLNAEFGPNGDIRYVYLFAAIALLILLIAGVNYVNLAIARSLTRAREVGVRKALGARRQHLIAQFMGEAILPAAAALLIALGLVSILLPAFNTLTARSISLEAVQHAGFWATLLLVGLGVGVLAGSYPAFVLSSFRPDRALKPGGARVGGRTTLRNALVLAQFTITTILVVGTIVMQDQLHYIQNANTGLERDQIISIEIKDQRLHERYAALKQTLERHPNVAGVTAATTDPTSIRSASMAEDWEGAADGERLLVYRSRIQPGYVDLFGLEIVEGRDLSEAIASDATEGMLINEAMRRQLGWDTAVGKPFNFFGREARITGVVRDFNFHSFHQEIGPLALFFGSGWFAHQRLFVKVRPQEVQETLAYVSETLAEFSPAYPFEYHFLDDAYNQMYQAETRLGTLFGYFTALALLIAGLGLLGLAAFSTAQRTKEVGVRKVLGASVGSIVFLLSRHFLALVSVSFIIAAPVAYVAAERWLDGFAYRIEVGPGLFVSTGLVVLVIALGAVSYQALRAAMADPVKSLRYE